MSNPYIAILTTVLVRPTIIVHLMSSFTDEVRKIIQQRLDDLQPKEGTGNNTEPQWCNADVVILFHGPYNEDDSWLVRMPDGRFARVINIFSTEYNAFVDFLGKHVDAMDLARRCLRMGAPTDIAALISWDAYYKLVGGRWHREALTDKEEFYRHVYQLEASMAENGTLGSRRYPVPGEKAPPVAPWLYDPADSED
jgi:hypothetical protein